MAILLVEDEPNVVSVIKRGLAQYGYEISVATDGATGLQMITDHDFEMVIMDIMLPSIDGIQLCKRVREFDNQIPVIMLTALDSTENIVTGLESGADDYLAKPFKMAELAARVKTLLRRRSTDYKPLTNVFKMGDVELDADAKIVKSGGQSVSLSPTEYRLLEYFMKNQKKVLSRIQILESVWDINFNMGTNVVDVYVNYLRKKLDKTDQTRYIQTVFGMGYIMKDNE